MIGEFNPDMMILARSLKEWKQADLAVKTGKTQAYVSKVERRVLPPSEEFINQLSEFLDFPRSFFFQPGHLSGLPASVHPMYRKQTSKAKVLERVHAEMNLRILHLRLLPPSLTAHMANLFSAIIVKVAPSASDPKGTAQRFRWAHGIISGPVEDLMALAEKSGMVVLLCDFGDETDEAVDGVSMLVPSLPPTIFLNKKRPADRMRFSLAHEMGHILMHRVPSDTMESEANEFAAELLMPEADMRIVLIAPITLNKLAALKPDWRVSIGALLYRSGKLGLMDDQTKARLYRQLSVLGWKKQEPSFLDFAGEKPRWPKEVFGGCVAHNDNLPQQLHTYKHRLEVYYDVAA